MKNKKISAKILDELLSFLEAAIISLFVMTLVFTYLFGMTTVKGDSMKNTLMPNDRIVTVASWLGKPKQGDIVIAHANEAVTFDENGNLKKRKGLNKLIIKRVIAVEGQEVDIDFDRGAVYVDGKMLDENYITELTHVDEGAFTGKYPIEVPKGYVFVMGDNRRISRDSRSSDIGFVSVKSITGKAVLRVSPPESFGFVN